MPRVTDRPPERVQEELADLRAVLDETVPPKKLDENLLVGTWNLRAFGGLTRKWEAGDDDSPKRDLRSLHSIAAVIRRFDVVALQEVRGELRALRDTLRLLGPHWGLSLTDVTRGDRGNGERMAFLFDTRKCQLSGLACELVVPAEREDEIAQAALHRQFARTPYAVSFRAGGKTFILVTLHVLWGDSSRDRLPELRAIARWMADWANDMNAWDHNLIVLGDFNIEREGDPTYDAFTSTGLTVPDDLHEVPRTIFAETGAESGKYYDQVAWFTGEGRGKALSLDYGRGGHVDFVPVVREHRGLGRQALSWRISDHYPLWVEFLTR